MENNQNNPKRNPQNEEKNRKGTWFSLIVTIAVVLAGILIFNSLRNAQYKEVTYSDFLQAKEEGQLTEVEIYGDRIKYLTKAEEEKPAAQRKAFYTGLPFGDVMALANELDAIGVKVEQVIVEDNSTIIMLLGTAGMFLVTFLLMRSLTKRM